MGGGGWWTANKQVSKQGRKEGRSDYRMSVLFPVQDKMDWICVCVCLCLWVFPTTVSKGYVCMYVCL